MRKNDSPGVRRGMECPGGRLRQRDPEPTMETFSNRSLARLWGPQCQSQWQTLSWRTWRKEHSAPAHTHHPHSGNGTYIDDTFTALPEEQVDWFLDHLNMVEPSIKFTMEKESNGSLSFLDTLVTHHDDGSLSTSVYRKKTHTDRYLDFTSHHPLAHKVAVARTLMTRANRICTFALRKPR